MAAAVTDLSDACPQRRKVCAPGVLAAELVGQKILHMQTGRLSTVTDGEDVTELSQGQPPRTAAVCKQTCVYGFAVTIIAEAFGQLLAPLCGTSCRFTSFRPDLSVGAGNDSGTGCKPLEPLPHHGRRHQNRSPVLHYGRFHSLLLRHLTSESFALRCAQGGNRIHRLRCPVHIPIRGSGNYLSLPGT